MKTVLDKLSMYPNTVIQWGTSDYAPFYVFNRKQILGKLNLVKTMLKLW